MHCSPPSVIFAAALGAIVGALASGGFSTPAPAKPDVAAIEENKAMQQSLAQLAKEVTTLKASLEAANKAAHTQIAKISERLEHAETPTITGSISAPQTAPASTGADGGALAAAASARRHGGNPAAACASHGACRAGPSAMRAMAMSMCENRGEIYQVVPGAPLPASARWNRSSGRTAAGW